MDRNISQNTPIYPKNILLLTGPGTHLHLLRKALQECGLRLTVVEYYPDWKMVTSEETARRILGYRLAVWLLWALWRRLPYYGKYETPRTWQYGLYDALVALHFPAQIDLVWGWSGMSLFTLRKAKKRHLPTLLEMPMVHPNFWNRIAYPLYAHHPTIASAFGLLPASLIRRIRQELELADGVIVPSLFARDTFLAEGFPPHKLHHIPLGVETDEFVPAERLVRRPFRFLYIGRLDLLKGVTYLLEAWKRLRLPQAELWIIGPALPEVKPILRRYEGLFQYWGPKHRKDLPPFYREGTVFIFPTLLDSFGMTLLEAMASGLPAIATRASVAPEVIRPAQEGLLIPSGSVEALMEAMESLYRHPDLEAMGQAARRRIEADYSLAAYQRRLSAFLEKFLGSRKTPAPAAST
ncbi:MAG: glycosyltransferase family 4 protein [Bacteroidia bacterium]|nr:glycosyltransferase family 4 protein [Bacteroidia bacterium]MDW8088912.1 glycosyltransferase family 4 protein [Bacteroidia bacterium]